MNNKVAMFTKRSVLKGLQNYQSNHLKKKSISVRKYKRAIR